MRAYYRLSCTTYDSERDALAGAILLAQDTEAVYLLSLSDPSQALDACGAERLGARLGELDWPVIELITNTRVRRVVDDATVDLVIPTEELLESDEVLEEMIPRVMIAGDSIEDYR